jgi:folate-dependent phosphoribosylglycinamide formyltransferase PurN
VAIEPADTVETLEARIHATEHILLVETLQRVITQPDFTQG